MKIRSNQKFGTRVGRISCWKIDGMCGSNVPSGQSFCELLTTCSCIQCTRCIHTRARARSSVRRGGAKSHANTFLELDFYVRSNVSLQADRLFFHMVNLKKKRKETNNILKLQSRRVSFFFYFYALDLFNFFFIRSRILRDFEKHTFLSFFLFW